MLQQGSGTLRLLIVAAAMLLAPALGRETAHAAWPGYPRTMLPAGGGEGLDDETLASLVIFPIAPGAEPTMMPVGTLVTTLQVQPGATMRLVTGIFVCCYFFEPVMTEVVWSVSPEGGVTVDPTSGLLTVDPATPSGSVFTVSADVERGRRQLSVELHVYTPTASPLVGGWMEATQIACDSGAEIVPAEPISELIFNADGTFSVTWFPFEVYKDYWGTYRADPTGTLTLVIEGGNSIPSDFDGEGRYAFDQAGGLILSEIWLGASPSATGAVNCGHRFVG